MFGLFFRTPLRWVTLGFLLTASMMAIQAVMGWRTRTDIRPYAAIELIVFLLGLAGFAVWVIPQCKSGSRSDNDIRGGAITVLMLCILFIHFLGAYLRRTRRNGAAGRDDK
jgi:negative regulator of sigma E activity